MACNILEYLGERTPGIVALSYCSLWVSEQVYSSQIDVEPQGRCISCSVLIVISFPTADCKG